MPRWSEVRAALVRDFKPYAFNKLQGPARRAALRLWQELQIVETAGAWRSTSALSGQLLELVIKQALLDRHAPASIAKKPLGPVLEYAEGVGLFQPPTPALTVANSVYAAKELRNIASHGSPWQEDGTEQRATYSIVYLICFLGYLYPTPGREPDGLADLAEPSDREPEIEFDALANDAIRDMVTSSSAHDHDVEIVDQFEARVRNGSPRTVLSASRGLRANPALRPLLAEIVCRNFGYVIQNIGHSRIRNVYEFARWCQRNDMPSHARCVAILLPHNEEALSYFAGRSPTGFAKYLYECRRAEPRLFDKNFRTGGTEAVATISTRWISDPKVAISNTFNIMTLLPTENLTQQISANVEPIRQRLFSTDIPSAVAFLRLLKRARSLDPHVRDGFLESIVNKIQVENDEQLAATPLRLFQLGIIDDNIADKVINKILERAEHQTYSYAAQRILWDIDCFSLRHAKRANEVAIRRFADLANEDDLWVKLLCVSVLLANGAPIMIRQEELQRCLTLDWPKGETDWHQQLRVGFVLASLDVPLPTSRVRHLIRLIAKTRPLTLRMRTHLNNWRLAFGVPAPPAALVAASSAGTSGAPGR